MKFDYSDRLKLLPPYLFVEIDKLKQKAIDDGVDVINLGVGDSDISPPKVIREELKTAVDEKDNFQYPLGKGKLKFRTAIAKFLKKRFNIEMNPMEQIHPMIGSKEGIAHFPLAFINPGDTVLIPEPAYPVYNSGTIFAGGIPYFMPLKEVNDFLPDYSQISVEVFKRAKMLYINYPNNPTGASATKEFFKKTVDIAFKYNLIIVHDAAYSELYFDTLPLSFFEVDGAKDVGIEFHSLSKTFSMTGWRVGWACGNEKLIGGLSIIKDNIDSGVFGAIQDAASTALENDYLNESMRATYYKRAKIMKEELRKAGWHIFDSKATFYIWAKPPKIVKSIDAVQRIIKEVGVICTPGSGFGPSGEGYVRFALTKNVARIEEAIGRLKKIKW